MLTDSRVKKSLPRDRDYKIADQLGLFLLVRPNGSKLWRLRYRFAGKERLLALGRYPEMSLAEARSRRDDARQEVSEQKDPVIEKRRRALSARAAVGHTFESLAKEWHELNKSRWAPVHAADVLQSLDRDIFPMLGALPIGMIDAPLLLDALRPIEKRGSIETAKRVRQRVSAVFVYAISLGIVTSDPASIISKALRPKPKAKKQPAVTDMEELRRILDVTERSGAYPVTLLASRFLALTAVRPGTLRGTRWDEFVNLKFDDEIGGEAIWHIPAERMKLTLDRKDEGAFDHIVPLVPAAVDVLRAVRFMSGNCELVFPGQRHAHRPLSENAIGYLYNRCGWHSQHVPHGWRAAFSTIMNEWAVEHGGPQDRSIIDMMLSHVPKDKVEGAYNRAQFQERRRELAQIWADMVMKGARPAADLLEMVRRARA